MFSNRSQLLSSLKDSLKIAQFQGFRVLLVLSGHSADHKEDVIEAFQDTIIDSGQVAHNPHSVTRLSSHIMHVPDQHSNSDITDQINKLLGSENSCLVFDAHDGFDPRMLAASAGTVVAGGLYILITPPLQDWLYSKSYNTDAESAFLKRFAGKLLVDESNSNDGAGIAPEEISANTALLIDASSSAYGFIPDQSVDNPDPLDWKAEQDALLEALLHRLIEPTAGNVIVVQGDRGRGKSALVGRAISQYLKLDPNDSTSISLCASAQPSCTVLLKHASSSMPFFTIEQALNRQHDILIVEEAGNIPIAVLEKLLHCSKTTVFITTVQGYEGAGRGFAIRFAKTLERVAPAWLNLNPQQPVRWSPGDPLEAFINDAFLLDVKPISIEPSRVLNPKDSLVSPVSASELLANEFLLREVYGLLIQAHYQTTPADLRNILDKDGVLVFVQHTNNRLTGAALVALEGNIPTKLHGPIMQKQRRLNDQIIPQLLAQSSGDGRGLSLRYARIVRIAIVPSIQNKGFGKSFFAQLSRLLSDKADCIGASFGADKASLSFWLSLGLKPIHYGYKVNPRSGLRAACLASSEHPQASTLIANASRILHINTSAFVECQSQNDTVAPLILAASETALSELTRELSDALIQKNISAFNSGNRSFIDTAGLLLAHATANKDATLKSSIKQTIADFSTLNPSARREHENLLRTLLSAYIN